jgi:hypothetical protein
VYWVAVSADGQFAVAGGETVAKGIGLLNAYRVADGVPLLSATPASRVNQVALSRDGSVLLAVWGDTVMLYGYDGSAYVLLAQQAFAGASCGSCALAPDGTTAVVGCTLYHDGAAAGETGGRRAGAAATPSTGQVVTLAISGAQLSVAGVWNTQVGVQRVAMAASSNYWAAALHDGSCALLGPANSSAPLWQYRPAMPNLDIAYGIDITETGAGRVVLACAANLRVPAPAGAANQGYLYLVESVAGASGQQAQFCWGSELQYSGNPGVSLAREAQCVSATDGQPIFPITQPLQETPGNFYLFDGASGQPLWRYPTPIMNWPMALTPDGTRAFGGSDDGSVYYWEQAAP